MVEAAGADGEPIVSAAEVRQATSKDTKDTSIGKVRGAIAMRSVHIALTSLLLVSSASAQEKAQPRPVLPEELLKAYLGKWEEHLAKVDDCSRTAS